MTTHYEVLGVSPDATADDIRRAYKQAAMRLHPDRGGSVAEFTRLRAAYKALRKCETCGGSGIAKSVKRGVVTRSACPNCEAGERVRK